MMRTVHLYGRLGKQFGSKHRFDVRTAAEALRALNCAFPGQFVEALQTGHFKLVRGDKRSGMILAEINLINQFGLGGADLHLIPSAIGAGNGKGVAKTIIGVALIGGAIFMSGGTLATPLASTGLLSGVTWGNIALVGIGVALSGVASLMAKPAASTEKAKDNSFSINGPNNMGTQGTAIQLIYGECVAGSVCVSFDADIEDIGAYQGATASLGYGVQPYRNVDGSVGYYGGPPA